jgi:signal recognition particle subunit SRP54
VFDTLSDRLTQVFSSLRGRGRLSSADIDATAREIRIALLEADVALPVVRQFIARVKERANGEEVSAALNPAQQVIKIVHEELVGILGGETRRLRFAKVPPTVIMLAGLQGSGKTSLAAKLALWLKEQGNTPMLVAADLQRPNAVQQLQVMGERAGVPVYAPQPGNGVGDPVAVARDSLEEARRRQQNMVIIDTAGRTGIDQEMMAQAVAIRDATQPDEILFVVDAMIGQDAVATALAFRDGVGYDGVVLTKLDGDARGGAALSIVELTGRPIMFASSGEKLEDFDVFHPDRMASRILDMGDILTLIEQAEKNFDADQTASLAGRLASGEGFTLEDFVDQLSMVRKLGPIGNLLGMLPGAAKNRELLSQVSDRDLDRAEAIVRSMTPQERRDPKIINGSRRARIANGSGVAVGEVSQLVTNFFEGQKQMKAMFSGGMPGMPAMPGMGAARRAATKSARKKGGKKKAAPRSGDPRRAAEIARAAAAAEPAGPAVPGLGAGGLGGLPGGLPEGFPENLADGLANLPPGLNFPSPPQGNVPAAFRGGKRRDKRKLSRVEPAHRLDGVGLGGGLVLAVPEHAGEAQREATWVPGAALDAVEGDLHDEFRPHVHGVGIPVVFQREQPFGLPGQQLIGQALERLAQHDESARVRVAGAQVQVGQPAAASPVAPLDGQHHQVQGVPGLDLDPPGAAAAGRVRGLQRLDHDAFVSVRERIAEELARFGDRASDQAGHKQLGWHGPGQFGVPPPVGQVDQVHPVGMQHVEQKHRKLDGGGFLVRLLAGGAGRGVLEGQRPAVRPQRDQLAVEDRRAHRQLGQRRNDLGEPAGDLIQGPGEQAHGAFGQMGLDPDAVELPLHRRLRRAFGRGAPADLGQGVGDARSAGGEHRPDRSADLQAEGVQGVTAARQRGGGHRAERAAHHHRPANLGHRYRSRAGDGLGHHAFQRALPQLTGEQAIQKLLLGLGSPAEQLADQRLPRGRRPLAGDRADRGEPGVYLAQRQRGGGRRDEPAPQRGPAHADLPLR